MPAIVEQTVPRTLTLLLVDAAERALDLDVAQDVLVAGRRSASRTRCRCRNAPPPSGAPGLRLVTRTVLAAVLLLRHRPRRRSSRRGASRSPTGRSCGRTCRQVVVVLTRAHGRGHQERHDLLDALHAPAGRLHRVGVADRFALVARIGAARVGHVEADTTASRPARATSRRASPTPRPASSRPGSARSPT